MPFPHSASPQFWVQSPGQELHVSPLLHALSQQYSSLQTALQPSSSATLPSSHSSPASITVLPHVASVHSALHVPSLLQHCVPLAQVTSAAQVAQVSPESICPSPQTGGGMPHKHAPATQVPKPFGQGDDSSKQVVPAGGQQPIP